MNGNRRVDDIHARLTLSPLAALASLPQTQGRAPAKNGMVAPLSGFGEGSGVGFMARILLGIALLLMVIAALPALAQEGDVTADEVNAIAKGLYCPVCPNETLDACQTQACVQWRAEIRDQLEEGQTPDQVVANFVDRYGDRVVPIPQDPTLRTLSLITPYIIALAALVAGVATFMRWRMAHSRQVIDDTPTDTPAKDDPYRSLMERDLSE